MQNSIVDPYTDYMLFQLSVRLAALEALILDESPSNKNKLKTKFLEKVEELSAGNPVWDKYKEHEKEKKNKE